MERREKYVLWLPSWYPNPYNHTIGDFIQRQAQATALFLPVKLVHFVQEGPERCTEAQEKTIVNGGLEETTVAFRYRPGKFSLFNKIRYSYTYYRFAHRFLLDYFDRHGLPEKVHVQVPLKAGNLALWIKKKFDIPYVISEHASSYLKAHPHSYFNKGVLYRYQLRRIFRNAAKVINVSSTIGSVLERLFNLPQVITIHNVVDVSKFYCSPGKHDTFTFIHVSSLSYQKNIEGILRVFGQFARGHQHCRLEIVGPHNTALEDLARTFDIADKVIFRGEVSYTEVSELMKNSHAFVLFSRHENFPCVVIEALCCGLPVVSADVAGVKEAIDPTNGILVPPGDEKALLEAFVTMYDQYARYDPQAIARSAAARYSYPVIGSQIFNLY